MKYLKSFAVVLVVLALLATTAAAAVLQSSSEGGRLDLSVTGDESTIKVTVTSSEFYSGCEFNMSFDTSKVTYSSYEKSKLVNEDASYTVSGKTSGNLYLTCYAADAAAGDIVTLTFTVNEGASGDVVFELTEGMVGVRDGLDIPTATLGEAVSIEVAKGSIVDAEKITAVTCGDTSTDVTFDGTPSSKWYVVVAGYNNDGKMTHCVGENVSGDKVESVSFTRTAEDIKVKAFVLNNSTDLVPMMKEYEAA